MIKNAVILAAGKGTHIWPYGETNPKAALPIANAPLIHQQLDALREAGIEQVAVVVGHLEGMTRAACESWRLKQENAPEIRMASLPNSRGTAHSAKAGLEALSNPQAAACILLGDVLFDADSLASLLKASSPKQAACLVGPVDPKFSQICFQAEIEGGRIKSVHAHSRANEPNWKQLAGVMTVPEGFIGQLAATPDIPTCVEIGAMPSIEQDLFESLHQYVKQGGIALAVDSAERFIDIDRPWDLLEANMLACEWIAGGLEENQLEPGASIDDSARIEGFVKLGAGSKIGPGVIVYGNLVVGKNTLITDGAYIGGNTIIGDDCRVWRGCLVGERTVIGHRCVVGHGAEVEGLMMDEAYSYHYGEFWGILGKCCDLGAATVCGTLRFDDGETTHRVKSRKESPRYHANASYLGDYVRTGVNAILMPGVKVGAYSLIGAGVVLNEDVPARTGVFVEQTLRKTAWGPERYGW